MSVDQLIQESQTWLEQFQATRRAELNRLLSRLGQLETKRSELLERVSRDNADRGSQDELDRTDAEMRSLQEQIAAVRNEVHRTIVAKRGELAAKLNAHIAELQAEVARCRAEKERIRTELLPALERQREELHDRSRNLESEILQMTEQIAALNRIQINTEDLEFI